MSIKNIFATIFAVVAFASLAMAQTGQTPPKPQEGGQMMRGGNGGERGGRFGRGEGSQGGPGMMRMGGGRGMGGHGIDFNRLNLTDAQKQRIQALRESSKTSMEARKAQMEEMGKLMGYKREGILTSEQGTRLTALEAQMKTSYDKMESDLMAILTPEQKVLVDQMKKEREQFRGRGGRGGGGMMGRPGQGPGGQRGPGAPGGAGGQGGPQKTPPPTDN